MKKLTNTLTKLLTGALVAGLGLTFNACSEDSAMGPQTNKSVEKLEQSNIGAIHILEIANQNSTTLTLAKGKGKGKGKGRGRGHGAKDSTFFAEKLIKAKRGGIVEVGNRTVGKSKIEFKKGDLPEDLTISFEWAASGTLAGMLSSLEFGPHGTQFNNPVKVELSYKMADVKGIDESKLRIFYFNEETGLWELVGGEVDKRGRKVTVYVAHFSRYAVAWSR